MHAIIIMIKAGLHFIVSVLTLCVSALFRRQLARHRYEKLVQEVIK
jgi:hypothetical protein